MARNATHADPGRLRRPGSAGLWAGVALAALAAGAPPASAHPSLLSSAPAPGSILGRAPTRVQLAFTENVELRGSSLRVGGPRATTIRTGPLVRTRGAPGLAARLPPRLGPGVYAVRWVALGADGHTVSGSFRFAVARPGGALPAGAARLQGSDPGGRGAEVAESEGVLTVAARWLSILSAALLLGSALLEWRLRAAGRRPPSQSLATLRLWAVALAVLGAAELVAVAATGGDGGALRPALLVGSTTGALALARLAIMLAAVAVVALVAARRRAAAGALAGVAVLVTHALDGHTAALTSGRLLADAVRSLHVLGAGVWAGGLLALAALVFAAPRSERTEQARAGARALAPLAVGGAGVVALTGVVTAVHEVGAWYFLRWSDYGRVVIVKSALWLAMAGLGTVAFLLWRRAATGARRPRLAGGLLRVESVLGVAVVGLAAVLAGLVQGRGQPLPAQRGNLLAGAAFANAPVGGALARVTLAPAQRGSNELSVLVGPLDLGNPAPHPRRVRVRLSCPCAPAPRVVALARPASDGGAWRARVELPAEGLWEARVTVDGRPSLGALPLSVRPEGAAGAPPIVAVSTADLTGPGADRCRSQALGVLLSLAGANAAGGRDGGRKVVQRLYDDGGDPGRAAAIVAASRASALVAPCGAGAGGALDAARGRMPAIVADPSVPVVAGDGVFRTAPGPATEGFALGQLMRSAGLQAFPQAPRRIAVLAPRGPSARLVATGLRDSLKGSGIGVTAVGYDGAPGARLVRRAIDGRRYLATYLDGDRDRLASVLAAIGRREPRIVPAAIFASSRLFDERFEVDSGLLGRIGSLRAIGEVSPLSRDGFGYSNLVRALYAGERPTIAGLRGYVAGQALLRGISGDLDAASIESRLARATTVSDALSVGPAPERPWSGSELVGFFLPSFLPSGLIPRQQGGQQFQGSYFQDGAWKVMTSRLYGPRAKITAE